MRLGFLSADELDEEFQHSGGSEVHLGKRLVDSNRITLKQLRDAVMEQLLDIMRETMAWKVGAFHFDDNRLPFLIPDDTLVRTPSLLLEASRMADERGYAETVFSEKTAILEQEEWSSSQAGSTE